MTWSQHCTKYYITTKRGSPQWGGFRGEKLSSTMKSPNMSVSIAPETRSTPRSLSKLKPEQERDVLKILSTSLPQICCRDAFEVQHLLESKHGCQRAQTTQDVFQQSLSLHSEQAVSLHSCLNSSNKTSNTRSQKLSQWHELPCSLWKTWLF